jgi:hypothetical protein
MQCICGLLHSYVVSFSFALCFAFSYILITRFKFFIICFMFLFLYLCYAFYFACSVFSYCVLCLLMHVVISSLFVYKFTVHCHQMETKLQLINIISYNINILTQVCGVITPPPPPRPAS